MKIQIHYISFGNKVNTLVNKSIDSIKKYLKDIDYTINIITDSFKYDYDSNINISLVNKINKSNIINSRYYKTSINNYIDKTIDYHLYLDADTIILNKDIDKIIKILSDGFDLVICPSTNQESNSFWHIQELEKQKTFEQLEYQPLQLQGGVFAWNVKTDIFFDTWFNEWNKYKDQDQAALVRALAIHPVKYYLLSNVFNGGSVVKHNFGATK